MRFTVWPLETICETLWSYKLFTILFSGPERDWSIRFLIVSSQLTILQRVKGSARRAARSENFQPQPDLDWKCWTWAWLQFEVVFGSDPKRQTRAWSNDSGPWSCPRDCPSPAQNLARQALYLRGLSLAWTILAALFGCLTRLTRPV